jgi:hypothetical protein
MTNKKKNWVEVLTQDPFLSRPASELQAALETTGKSSFAKVIDDNQQNHLVVKFLKAIAVVHVQAMEILKASEYWTYYILCFIEEFDKIVHQCKSDRSIELLIESLLFISSLSIIVEQLTTYGLCSKDLDLMWYFGKTSAMFSPRKHPTKKLWTKDGEEVLDIQPGEIFPASLEAYRKGLVCCANCIPLHSDYLVLYSQYQLTESKSYDQLLVGIMSAADRQNCGKMPKGIKTFLENTFDHNFEPAGQHMDNNIVKLRSKVGEFFESSTFKRSMALCGVQVIVESEKRTVHLNKAEKCSSLYWEDATFVQTEGWSAITALVNEVSQSLSLVEADSNNSKGKNLNLKPTNNKVGKHKTKTATKRRGKNKIDDDDEWCDDENETEVQLQTDKKSNGEAEKRDAAVRQLIEEELTISKIVIDDPLLPMSENYPEFAHMTIDDDTCWNGGETVQTEATVTKPPKGDNQPKISSFFNSPLLTPLQTSAVSLLETFKNSAVVGNASAPIKPCAFDPQLSVSKVVPRSISKPTMTPPSHSSITSKTSSTFSNLSPSTPANKALELLEKSDKVKDGIAALTPVIDNMMRIAKYEAKAQQCEDHIITTMRQSFLLAFLDDVAASNNQSGDEFDINDYFTILCKCFYDTVCIHMKLSYHQFIFEQVIQ